MKSDFRTMTGEEIAFATDVGHKRQSFSSWRPGAHGFRGDGLKINVLGAIGELALSLHTGESWTPFVEDFTKVKADVGEWFQVRATDHPRGNLPVHDVDPDFQIFVLVRLHSLPVAEFCGWYAGRSAKQPCFWEDGKKFAPFKRRPAYLVLVKDLNGMNTLPTQAKWAELLKL